MKIMAIDTSGPNCCVAVLDEEKVIANFSINIGRTHSETLLPLIDELCKYSNIELKDVDLFACCVGPGSFTGIRIGISTIKGFAIALNKPVISVSTLESLAYNIPTYDWLICSMINANNNNVYSALFEYDDQPKMIGDYYTDSIDDYIIELKKYKNKILFVGDGALFYKSAIENELKENAIFVPQHLNEQSAISIARCALNKYNNNVIENADELHPLYLRKSQAERMFEQGHNNE